MNFDTLTAARYSVRKFSEKLVEPELLDRILAVAQNAPTAANKQPQRILVIDSEESLKKLDACTPCRFGAPLVLLICYDKEKAWVRPFDKKNYGEIDASIVTTQMMLQIADLGLGSTWVMYFDPLKVREAFAIPEKLVPVALLVAGYPADTNKHTERYSIETTVYRGDFSEYR